MKRTLLKVLLGTSMLIPIDAEAQRNRGRNGQPGRQVVAPATARLANCRAPSGGRAYVCNNDMHRNTVYRYAGNTRRRVRRSWVPARWGRVHMYPVGRRAMRGTLNQGALRDILGRATVQRVRDLGRRQGLRGGLRGHWFESRQLGSVLTITMGGRDVIEFVDFNRDGLVDDVFVRNSRRW